MQLNSLGTDFQPDKLVEGYSSLIWSERYREAGDFELKTHNIESTLNLLPLNSLVAVRDGFECMFVESQTIEKNTDGETILTVTGRSFETFLEHRVARPTYGMRLYNAIDTSLDWRPFAAGEYAATIAGQVIIHKTMESPDIGENVPNLFVNVEFAAKNPPFVKRIVSIPLGTVYERVLEILAMDDLGIRTNLPQNGETDMNIYIYTGKDKTNTVTFSVSEGHFKKASYLWSNREYENAVAAFSYYRWLVSDFKPGATGMARRTGFVDASDVKTDPNGVSTADDEVLKAKAKKYINDHRMTAVFDGEVSPDIPYKYMVDYGLGDLVKVIGDYGVDQDMQVVEYVRIEDNEGERAYPALKMLD